MIVLGLRLARETGVSVITEYEALYLVFNAKNSKNSIRVLRENMEIRKREMMSRSFNIQCDKR
jgi:hypothetical protein